MLKIKDRWKNRRTEKHWNNLSPEEKEIIFSSMEGSSQEALAYIFAAQVGNKFAILAIASLTKADPSVIPDRVEKINGAKDLSFLYA